MRKEISIAIIAGIVFGLVIAFVVWRTNASINNSTIAEQNSQTLPQPFSQINDSQENFSIVLTNPNDQDVVTALPFEVTGKTRAEAWITLSTENEDYIAQADSSGDFSMEVDLEPGINTLFVTAFDGKETAEKSVTVIYTSELLAESKNNQ